MIRNQKTPIESESTPSEVDNFSELASTKQQRNSEQLLLLIKKKKKTHKTHYEAFVDQPVETYVKLMSRESTFGDNLTLQALAREFSCQFLVINAQGTRYHRIISNSGVYENELNTFTLGFYPEVHYVSVVTDNDSLRILSNQLSFPSVGPSNGARLECDSEPEDPIESENTPSEENNTTDVHPIDSDQDDREEINTFYEIDQEKSTNKPKLILHMVSRVEERAFNRGNTCPVESRCGDSINRGTFANEPGDLTSDNTNLIDIEGTSNDTIANIRYENTV